MQPVVVAAISLAGAFIGAALSYVYSRSLEARKQLAAQRALAYIDFFRAVAAVSQNRTQEQLALAADAKTRICISGSAQVVQRLAEFERSGANLSNTVSRSSLIKLVSAMRRDVVLSDAMLNHTDLSDILFGLDRDGAIR